MDDDIAAFKSASAAAGTPPPPDNDVVRNDADVVWLSVLSLSLKPRVPVARCGVAEFVVFAVSLKLVVAADELKVGL
jgi:hypothetical protein